MPPLTTVSLPRAEIANAAFRVSLNAKQSDAPKPVQSEEHVVRPTFVAQVNGAWSALGLKALHCAYGREESITLDRDAISTDKGTS
jgi:hypothetical protein